MVLNSFQGPFIKPLLGLTMNKHVARGSSGPLRFFFPLPSTHSEFFWIQSPNFCWAPPHPHSGGAHQPHRGPSEHILTQTWGRSCNHAAYCCSGAGALLGVKRVGLSLPRASEGHRAPHGANLPENKKIRRTRKIPHSCWAPGPGA